MPIAVNVYAIIKFIAFININGTANLTLNTNGVPKTNGSLIPNSDGTADNLPNVLYCLLLAKKTISRAKPIALADIV
ncbi:hypothetical protein D3C76_1762600 [compost metagenome]